MLNKVSKPAGDFPATSLRVHPNFMILTFVEIPSNHNQDIRRPITLSPQGHLWKHGSLVILNCSLVPSFPVLSMVKYHPNYCSRKFVTLGKKKRWLEANETIFNQSHSKFQYSSNSPEKYSRRNCFFPKNFHLKKMDMECSCIKSPPPYFQAKKDLLFVDFVVGSRKVVIVDPPRQGLHQEVH